MDWKKQLKLAARMESSCNKCKDPEVAEEFRQHANQFRADAAASLRAASKE